MIFVRVFIFSFFCNCENTILSDFTRDFSFFDFLIKYVRFSNKLITKIRKNITIGKKGKRNELYKASQKPSIGKEC